MGNPTINYDSIDYGPCEQVMYGGVDLGAISGPITIKIGYEVKDKLAHQYGATPLGGRTLGDKCEVELTLGEISQSKLLIALQSASADGANVEVGGLAGQELTYGELVLYPVNTNQLPLTVYRAAPIPGSIEIVSGEDQAGMKITFRAYIDTSRALGDQLYKWGDPDDVTPPTIGTADFSSCAATNSEALHFTITDTESGVQTGIVKYGSDDDGNVLVVNINTTTAPALIAGTLAISAANATGTCTATFTPSTNWGTTDVLLVVTTHIRDKSGNRLANPSLQGSSIA